MVNFYKLWKNNIACKNANREIKEVNFDKEIYSKYIIIDIRGRREYKEKHLKHSINIPLFNLKHNISKYVKNHDDKILVYCESRYYKQKSSAYTGKFRV